MKNLARIVLGLVSAAALAFAGSAFTADDEVVARPGPACGNCV